MLDRKERIPNQRADRARRILPVPDGVYGRVVTEDGRVPAHPGHERHPRLHRLMKRFDDKTGCPVIINTSFNVRGEPIVCFPKDAYRCFVATDIDCLVIGNRLFHRDQQQSTLMGDEERDAWLAKFELD